jgi:hypothetical protein
MDDLFEQMLLDAEKDNELNYDTENIQNYIDIVKEIKAPQRTVAKKVKVLKVDVFDESMNLLNIDSLNNFKTESVYKETARITKPRMTTSTIFGLLTGVVFYEEELVKLLSCNKHILELRSNYGKKCYDKYIKPIQKQKPKKNKNSTRKKQGDGSEFSSQLTFVMNVYPELYTDEDIIPSHADIFKIKIFRNGKLQFPGNMISQVDNLLTTIKYIETTLNIHLKSEETELEKLIIATNVNVNMKNYNFRIIINNNTQVINLRALHNIFKEKTILKYANISIHDVEYNGSNTNMDVLFNTPVAYNPTKTLRLTIEKTGKCNIKGGLYVEHATEVCRLVDNIIMHMPHIIINKFREQVGVFNVENNMTDCDILAMYINNTI